MQIAWYSPTLDKIVVQELAQKLNLELTEKIITEDFNVPLGGGFTPLVAQMVHERTLYMMEQLELMMFYGSDFHWLEQGLWVRLGEV